MDNDREQRIREQAHSLWEQDGRPEGRAEEYWLRAEAMIGAGDGEHEPNMTSKPPV